MGTLLPAGALVNLRTPIAFQSAPNGLACSEARGPDPHDTFWTWRQLMFCFLEHIKPG